MAGSVKESRGVREAFLTYGNLGIPRPLVAKHQGDPKSCVQHIENILQCCRGNERSLCWLIRPPHARTPALNVEEAFP